MLAPTPILPNSPPEPVAGPSCCCADHGGAFVPHYSEEGPYHFCWTCHGYLVGPLGRRLCRCDEPGPLPPRLAEKARVLEGLRDALAEGYRRRWFKVLRPLLDGDDDDARAVWAALWRPARERAARKLASRGLS